MGTQIREIFRKTEFVEFFLLDLGLFGYPRRKFSEFPPFWYRRFEISSHKRPENPFSDFRLFRHISIQFVDSYILPFFSRNPSQKLDLGLKFIEMPLLSQNLDPRPQKCNFFLIYVLLSTLINHPYQTVRIMGPLCQQ